MQGLFRRLQIRSSHPPRRHRSHCAPGECGGLETECDRRPLQRHSCKAGGSRRQSGSARWSRGLRQSRGSRTPGALQGRRRTPACPRDRYREGLVAGKRLINYVYPSEVLLPGHPGVPDGRNHYGNDRGQDGAYAEEMEEWLTTELEREAEALLAQSR